MSETILEIKRLSKIYILGNHKNASKAQKEIQKLHKAYEHQTASGHKTAAAKTEAVLSKAEELFAAEEYEKSYQAITGKSIKPRPRDRGTVVHALSQMNLKIEAGDLVAIIGPSGSGKTTLLNMLGLLDQPTAGQVLVRGKNVSAIKKGDLPEVRSNELGFVFQAFNLVPTLTAIENVMLPLRYAGIPIRRRKQMAKEALEKVGLGERLNHRATELSGGQQQRVAIARSIVNNPSIIFGDELTGELDSKMTAEVMNLVLELNKQGHTFIIVTHNPDVAKLCRRVITMKDGKIEGEKTSK